MDPGKLKAELSPPTDPLQHNQLNAGFGNVTPDDEHEGRGEAIRKARREGMVQARTKRIAYHREQQGK